MTYFLVGYMFYIWQTQSEYHELAYKISFYPYPSKN